QPDTRSVISRVHLALPPPAFVFSCHFSLPSHIVCLHQPLATWYSRSYWCEVPCETVTSSHMVYCLSVYSHNLHKTSSLHHFRSYLNHTAEPGINHGGSCTGSRPSRIVPRFPLNKKRRRLFAKCAKT
ncbi:hypothetical protein J6590_048443, partial [Homalodisca vitripennis]